MDKTDFYEVSRNWFIEINPGASCFEEQPLNRGSELERLSPAFEGTLWFLNPPFYAFIKHDKDMEEDGTPKASHYHLVIKYKRDRDFASVQKDFPGAHIEKAKSTSSAVQYLTHQNKPDKAQYPCENIITNKPELLKTYLDIPQVEEFNPYDIWEYVAVDRMFQYTDFCIRFGVEQVKKYRLDIQEIIRDFKTTSRKSVKAWINDLDNHANK